MDHEGDPTGLAVVTAQSALWPLLPLHLLFFPAGARKLAADVAKIRDNCIGG